MAASSKSRSNAPVLPLTFSFPSQPSDSSSSPSSLASLPSTFAYSSSSSMTSSIFHRASSPTRVNLSHSTTAATAAAANAFRISLNNRSLSPNARASTVSRSPHFPAKFPTKFPVKFPAKKTCMCSPTSHPGSFRCAIHRNNDHNSRESSRSSISCSPMRLNLRRSAMTNSLVRIGTVEGDWVRRALTALIRPSSHQQRRRGEFRPRPSRLSIMSTAIDDDDDL
ncbi:hypothetical protein RND81_08G203700 [Saponaria officinalis]|uniref:Serine-rich protein-like protein n=1 Tax=Saponaria officinalis TaxID=3572 RepID=A0AAW1JA90_SAPOF